MNDSSQVNQRAADELNITQESERLNELAVDLLKKAKQKGATQAEIGISKDLGLSVQVRNQDIETLEFNRDNSLGLTVYFGHKKGVATSSDLSMKSLDETLNAACNIAKYTQEDSCSGLADAELMADKPVDLKLDHPSGITAEQAKQIALECETAGLEFDSKVSQSEGATYNSHRHLRFYANSHGFSAAVPSSRHSLSCVLIAAGANGMQRDYWYSVARNANNLQSPQEIGIKAAQRTIARLNLGKIKTQKAPVLMTPEVARGLLSSLFGALSGSSIYRQSSFLIDCIGEQIFPAFFNIKEMPFIEQGLASSWFDNEGVATREQMIVADGKPQTYLLGSYSARRLNMSPTGHAGGLHNVQLSYSDFSQQELIKKMDRGLIVTDVMGQGVNLVTGDYSRGASGYWVENGEIQYFVEEITIASNLKAMFSGLQAISNDLDFRSSQLTGSWLLNEMTIASN
ncbi:metalloprotease PmbA [Aliikangiella sp. IMCC44632]